MKTNINVLQKSNNVFRYISIGLILLALGFASDRYFDIAPICLIISIILIISLIVIKIFIDRKK